ncbi:MAG: C10 family peptidase [Bacteroidales bacterium]|nr:C10 family peptidase [Bacteroidales bacterium]
MKKIILAVTVLSLSLTAIAKPVTIETARRVATNFWNTNVSSNNPVFHEVSSQLELQNMYVFVTKGNDGFIIVAADDVSTPILGYSASNGIDLANEMPNNMKGWLKHYSDEIRVAINANMTPDASTAAEWLKLTGTKSVKRASGAKSVEPIIETHWDQTSPYNIKCPYDGNVKSVTGCVATAMAQVMKFWNWPIKGTGSKSYTSSRTSPSIQISESFDTTYQWTKMPLGGGNTANSWAGTQKQAVALLMYHCGVSVQMQYSYSASGAQQANVPNSMKTFFYYGSSTTYKNRSYSGLNETAWKNMLKTELDARRPVIYGGADANGEQGHSFVCDGYDANDKFHFNWGWSGSGDGYFALDAMTPDYLGTGGGDLGDFTYYQDAITGIVPGIQTAQSFTLTNNSFTVNGTISGTCTYKNTSMKAFVGYLGVAAYNANNELVTILTQVGSTSLNANSTKSLQINNVPVSPLTAGSYTAKAVCSVDGINWVPIVIGYNNCATEVPFIVTSSNGIDDINATHCHVFAHGRNIVVTEADNMPIRVVDIMGRVVYGEKNCGSNLSIPIQKSGIYLVKIGNEPAQKIIVK